MKKLTTLIGVTVLAIYSGVISAASNESTSTISIKNLVVMSNDDTISPAYSGLASVEFDSIPWLTVPTGCSSQIVLIKAGDKNLLSSVLSAYVSKTNIKVMVDDVMPAPLNGRCFLRAISF